MTTVAAGSPSPPPSSVEAPEFAARLAPLGPFEARPRLAVAVSGGGDSMALVLLAHEWASARGGGVVAATVDHGLRRGSAAEAAQVGRWLAERGIGHRVLSWTGVKPISGVQAAARRARYALLTEWARDEGILHLLVGHQADDQAETFLLRLLAGSGADGLAAMTALVETRHVRLVRPLLGVPAARLRATLAVRGQDWIEDSSNDDARFARARLRQARPTLVRAGLGREHLTVVAERFAAARRVREEAVSRLLGATLTLFPAGYAEIEAAPLGEAQRDVACVALARLLLAVGGGEHVPAGDKIARLFDAVMAAPSAKRCLGGCRVERREGRLRVMRETRGDERREAAGARDHWDGRFEVDIARQADAVWLARLGRDGWAAIAGETRRAGRVGAVPAGARAALPALKDEGGVVEAPHFGYRRAGADALASFRRVCFRPRNSLSGAGFFVAK